MPRDRCDGIFFLRVFCTLSVLDLVLGLCWRGNRIALARIRRLRGVEMKPSPVSVIIYQQNILMTRRSGVYRIVNSTLPKVFGWFDYLDLHSSNTTHVKPPSAIETPAIAIYQSKELCPKFWTVSVPKQVNVFMLHSLISRLSYLLPFGGEGGGVSCRLLPPLLFDEPRSRHA